MFRFIIVAIFLVLYLILTTPAMLVTWIIGKFNPHAGDVASLWVVNKLGFHTIEKLAGVKVKIIGAENIPDEPVLYIGNHRGFFDTILGYQHVKNPTGFVAKKEILYAPLLNIWMILLHCQFLDRKNPRSGMDMLLKSIELIKKGISVCIFPEGTRNRNADSDELLPFHAGSFKVATKTGAPVVPVTTVGTGRIWEDHFPRMEAHNVVIEYGTPIQTKGMSKDEIKALPDQVHAIIQETYIKNKTEYKEYLSR